MSLNRPRRSRWRMIPAVLAAGMVTIAIGSTGSTESSASPTDSPAGPEATEVDAAVPTIEWAPCEEDPGLRCAVAEVPLDYDHPSGPTTALRLVQRPADDPANRIGSLFVNPGGPGGSSGDYVPYVAQLFGSGVTDRFDVVGIDPRGVGGSTEARCKGSAVPPPTPSVVFPYTKAQVDERMRWDRFYRELCRTGGNPIIDHLSTADTARDMDLIRQALGEERLSYYGSSYGTYLGATYAAMFPDRIRAMVLDGVLDPVAWATGRGDEGTTVPFSVRVQSHRGSYDALTTAFDECDLAGEARCPLAGGSLAKWQRIVKRLQAGPVVIDGSELTYPDFVDTALGGIWDQTRYHQLMSIIDATYRAIFGDPSTRADERARTGIERLQRLSRLDRTSGPWTDSQAVVFPAYHAISCADTVNPSDPRAWIQSGRDADEQAPWFGRPWAWESSPCPGWPGSSADAFRGPWKVETSAPVLASNLHDPATPLSGALALKRKLVGSRLLIMDGWGHGALDASACVRSSIQRYFVDVELPPIGTSCQPDRELFPDPA